MIETVTDVQVLGGYRLLVVFDDGTRREVDSGPMLGGDDGELGEDFVPLRAPAFFARVSVDHDLGTIAWPNGGNPAAEFLDYGEAGPPPGYYGERVELREAEMAVHDAP